MSKIFYDHLVDLEHIETRIKKIAKTAGEREELYKLIDDIVNHRVLGSIFRELPEKHHKEFVGELKKRPHDIRLLKYIQERVTRDVKEFIKYEIHSLSTELLQIISDSTRRDYSK